MDNPKVKSDVIFLEGCPRLRIGVALYKNTWEEHIKPFHPLIDEHIPLIQNIIKNCDEQQSIWYKINNQERMCIVKKVPNFLPGNQFILIALNKYSDKKGCVTSIYPVNELPAKEKGYKLL